MALLIAQIVPDFSNFGTHALEAFRRSCESSIKDDQQHAVFYRLLADYADRLLDDYHQVPLPTSQAVEDLKHLKELIAIAESAVDQPNAVKFEAANTIASKHYY